MKTIGKFLLVILVVLLAGCTKSGSNTGYSNNEYTCKCTLHWLGKDTTMYFYFNSVIQDTAVSNCNAKTKWVQSIGGAGSGGCSLY